MIYRINSYLSFAAMYRAVIITCMIAGALVARLDHLCHNTFPAPHSVVMEIFVLPKVVKLCQTRLYRTKIFNTFAEKIVLE